MILDDIIAAISTPRGVGGVAVIRISGRGSVELCTKAFRPKYKNSILDYPPRHAIYGDIYDEVSNIDSGMLTYFRGPNSFTGEDMVEISCHGGVVVTAMVLGRILNLGARGAQAGEFTRRAFVNDRMTLSEAEAVGELLEAQNERGARLSQNKMSGALTKKLDALNISVTELVSSLYAYIDYPDEDLEDIEDGELVERIDGLIAETDKLAKTYKSGKAAAFGVKTVICGKANAGKSSLFNLLVGEKRAIVTDIPGTTRDAIESSADINGVVLKLWDTAGIRESSDTVEKIGIDISYDMIFHPETELILAIFDSSKPFDENDRALIKALSEVSGEKTVLYLMSKSDLERGAENIDGAETIYFSSKNGEGIDKIKKRICDLYIDGDISPTDGGLITNVRQLAILRKASETLSNAKTETLAGRKDIAGMLLEEVIGTISEIDSRSAGEKIVDMIFSKFCVGK